MDWNTFVEGLKEFWNQPVPIIGFTVGACIIGLAFIVSKTEIGKKGFNKLKKINEELQNKVKELLNKCEEYKQKLNEAEKKVNEVIELKESEVFELTREYQLKLNNYKEELLKQQELLKTVCENSVNKKIKEAYEQYIPEELDLPVGELKMQIEEKVKSEYEDRIKALEDMMYGRKEEENA